MTDWYETKAREIFQECEDAGWNFGRGISSSDLRALFRLVAAALREAAAREREACIKIAEACGSRMTAAAIRARKE